MLSEMIPVEQRFEGRGLVDVAPAMREALGALELGKRIRPGMRVGIPLGSRGIRQIPVLIREAVRHVKALGAEPVLVAAMGSHGGGTVEGQLEVLHSLGISEQAVEAPVHGGVEAAELARTPDGHPVYFDALMLGCDALLLINRIKPHTSFRGTVESGLVKMLVVGCGKPAGARQFHSFGAAELGHRLMEFGHILLSRLPVAGGIAILENGREEIADLVPVAPTHLITEEACLLVRSRELLPRLPVAELDLLVVDEMGKDISGTGMDTNVIGRTGIPGLASPGPSVGRLVVLDLTEGSHGNANGMGLADLVTRRLADKVDLQATYLNTLTTTFLGRAKLPMTLESDRAVIEAALRTLGSPAEPRIIRIKNTLELGHLVVSPPVLREIEGRQGISVAGRPVPWPFDEKGNLF